VYLNIDFITNHVTFSGFLIFPVSQQLGGGGGDGRFLQLQNPVKIQ